MVSYISGHLASAELFPVSLKQHEHDLVKAKGSRSTFTRSDFFEMYLKESLKLLSICLH